MDKYNYQTCARLAISANSADTAGTSFAKRAIQFTVESGKM